jgi:hemoglobin
MIKRQLDNREAIEQLVNSFYTSVKRDDLLGPIFNNAQNFSWDVHIPIMYDFWETLLLDNPKYRSNAIAKHIELNRRTPLSDDHFRRWKQLFYDTLDNNFDGPNVEKAHKKVEAIAGLMQHKINESSKKGFIQ